MRVIRVDANVYTVLLFEKAVSADVIWMSMCVDDKLHFQCFLINVTKDLFSFGRGIQAGVDNDGVLRFLAVSNVTVS